MTEFVESFGIYDLLVGISGTVSQKSLRNRWNSTGVGGGIWVEAGKGKRGQPALVLGPGASLARTLSHQSLWIIGYNINVSSTAGVGGGKTLDMMNNGQPLCSLYVNVDGSLKVQANGNGPIIATSSPCLTAAVDAYLEISATLTTSGSDMNLAVECWVNGVSQCTGSGLIGRNVNTLTSQTPTFNQLFIQDGIGGSTGRCYISDMYLNNGSGATNLTKFGTVEIDAYPLPNGDDGVQWTPLGGSGSNFSEINENPADGNASYVLANTVGKKDSYTWQDIVSFTGTVKSVQISYFARVDQEGVRAFQGTIGAGGTEAQTASFGLSFNYLYYHQAFDLDPATGLAWTRTGFNAKDFGISLVS